jgi:hypothetical protein
MIRKSGNRLSEKDHAQIRSGSAISSSEIALIIIVCSPATTHSMSASTSWSKRVERGAVVLS